jgi:hypothetical protein
MILPLCSLTQLTFWQQKTAQNKAKANCAAVSLAYTGCTLSFNHVWKGKVITAF